MRKITAYAHEVERLINADLILFVRPVAFPKHVPNEVIHDIASINMDGGGNWIAWSPLPVTDEVTKRLYPDKAGFPCPYGGEGDELWVQEAYAEPHNWTTDPESERPLYRYCDHNQPRVPVETIRWQSPVTMPRVYSRLTVRVTAVLCKRVMDITEEEAMRTAVRPLGYGDKRHINGLRFWWEGTYTKHGREWEDNPYAWLVSALHVGY